MTNAIVIVDSSKVNLLRGDDSAAANLDDDNVDDDDDDDATEVVPLVMGFVFLLLGFIFGFVGLPRKKRIILTKKLPDFFFKNWPFFRQLTRGRNF